MTEAEQELHDWVRSLDPKVLRRTSRLMRVFDQSSRNYRHLIRIGDSLLLAPSRKFYVYEGAGSFVIHRATMTDVLRILSLDGIRTRLERAIKEAGAA